MACGDLPITNINEIHVKPATSININIIIRKTVELLEDPILSTFIDRQIIYLNDLRTGLTYAYFVCDLPFAMRLIEILIERRANLPVYNEYISFLLSLTAVPPILKRFTDLLVVVPDIEEYFSFLGYMLLLLKDDKDLYKLITDGLWGMLNRKTGFHPSCISLQVCHDAIENSRLPESMTHLLELTIDEDVYPDLLKLCVHIASISENICKKMAKENAINTILLRFDPFWNKVNVEEDDDSFDSNSEAAKTVEETYIKQIEDALDLIKLLLNAIKIPSEDINKDKILPELDAMISFRYAFQVLVRNKKHKLNRNYLTCFLLQIMDIFPNLRLIQCQLVSDICILCAATDVSPGGTWAAEFRYSAEVEDYEFKKMLMLAVHYFSRWSGCLKIFQEKGIIYSLLQLITPEIKVSWHHDHLIKLKCYAFRVLEKVVPLLAKDFIDSNGTLRVIMLLELFTKDGYDMELLNSVLKCILTLLESKNLDIIQQFNGYLTEEFLIKIADYCLCLKCISTPYQNALISIFAIMESIMLTKDIPTSTKMNICTNYMERVLHPCPDDIKCDPKLMVCILSFTWELALQSQTNLHFLIDSGIIYMILDIIKDATFPVKIVGLGILVDLCDDGICIPFIITWRNKTLGILHLLMEIFREENYLLGVSCTDKGAIEDAMYPLMGKLQKMQMEQKEIDNSPSISDMNYSCRPKVYAILQLLNIKHKHITETANEEYRLYNQNLSLEDQITKLVSENYLTLKLGEAWVEMDLVLKEKGIEPILMDKWMISKLVQNYYKWGADLKNLQNELLKIDYKKQHYKEEEFYNILREAKLATALSVLLELKQIARTTESIFRMAKNMVDSVGLNSSNAHRTFSISQNINPIFEQKLSVQSDIIIQLHVEVPATLVSPYSSKQSMNSLENSDISLEISQHCELNMED